MTPARAAGRCPTTISRPGQTRLHSCAGTWEPLLHQENTGRHPAVACTLIGVSLREKGASTRAERSWERWHDLRTRSNGDMVIAEPMLVVQRSFTARYDGAEVHVRAGMTRVVRDHELARAHPDAWVPAPKTSDRGRTKLTPTRRRTQPSAKPKPGPRRR
jgi:hypothetical protein